MSGLRASLSHRRKALAGGGIVLLALVLTGTAGAQISSNQVKDRYDRNTKGTSIEDFVRKLNSDDPEKRLEGVKSLAESKDPKAVEHLVQAVGDSDMRIKAKAIDGLGDLRAADATPVLIQHLVLRETDEIVRQRILASLGKIGDPRAVPAIIDFLQRDMDPQTRSTAIFALGEIGNPDALPTLEDLVEKTEDPMVRRIAGDAVNKIHHQQAVRKTEAKEPQARFLKEEKPPEQ